MTTRIRVHSLAGTARVPKSSPASAAREARYWGVDRFVVRPGPPLDGTVRIAGAKNSVLKLLAATLLAEGEHVLRNAPWIADVESMCELLVSMGLEVHRGEHQDLVVRRPPEIIPEAPYELVERMRASVVVLGPLLAAVGR
ncbi:MAG: hypothetical protein M3404_05985, partial [Actinomycetota bacterium]|nr:hypothetical protein [Actinomycetota bacterium]